MYQNEKVPLSRSEARAMIGQQGAANDTSDRGRATPQDLVWSRTLATNAVSRTDRVSSGIDFPHEVQRLTVMGNSRTMHDPLAAYGELPVTSPPPGVTPNFIDPPYIGYQAVAAASVCLALILFFVGCRITTRFLGMGKGRNIWTEVLFMTGFALSIANIAAIIATVETGPWGKHEWDVKLKEYTKPTAMLLILVTISFALCLGFVKISLLVMYLEVFGRIVWVRYCAYVGIALIALFHSSTAIAYGTMCGPRPGHGHTRLSYMLALASHSCASTKSISIAQGVFHITADIFLLVLPIPAIKALQLPTKLKLGVFAMFLTGLFALAASCIGMYYRVRLAEYANDLTWYMIPGICAATGELTAGIVIFCIPSLTQLIKKFKHRETSSKGSSQEKSGTSLKAIKNKWYSNWDRSTVNGSHVGSYVTKKVSNSQDDGEGGFIFVPGAPSRAECWVEHGSETSSMNREHSTNHSITKKTEVKIMRIEQ